MLGVALVIACTTVVAFMFFCRMLQACGGAEFFTDISSALFGRYRGGSGKVEVVASGLFGTMSGSAVANIMSTGIIITIPNMKRAGYTPTTAGAIEAVSSTGGQIMPPVMGAAAFLMAENLQVRYAGVAMMITPPVAMAAYAAAHIASARPMAVGFKACQLGWPAFVVPFLFAYSPSLLLQGDAAQVGLAAAAAATVLVAVEFRRRAGGPLGEVLPR